MPQPNSLPVFDQTALQEFLAPETEAVKQAHEHQLNLATMDADWEDLEAFGLTTAAKNEHQKRRIALESKLADLSLRGRQIYIASGISRLTHRGFTFLRGRNRSPLTPLVLEDETGEITHAVVWPSGKIRLNIAQPAQIRSFQPPREVELLADRSEFIVDPVPDAFLERFVNLAHS